MVGNVGVHRANHTQVVGESAEMRKKLAHLESRLTVPAETKG